jgi:hypothetical protein
MQGLVITLRTGARSDVFHTLSPPNSKLAQENDNTISHRRRCYTLFRLIPGHTSRHLTAPNVRTGDICHVGQFAQVATA